MFSKSLVSTIEEHTMPIRDLMIIEESGHLVSCSEDGIIHIWNYPKKKIV